MELAIRFDLLGEIDRVLRMAEDVLNRNFKYSARVNNRSHSPVVCKMWDSAGIGAIVTKEASGPFVISVPRGLGPRLLAWLRVLMPYWGKGGVDLDVSPFVGFDKESYRLPEELNPIFGDWKDVGSLEKAIREMRFRRPLDSGDVWTLRIEPILGLAALYIVLHEGGHVGQRHHELQPALEDEKRLAEFGLTPLDVRRSLEIEADRVAAVWTADAVAEMAAGPRGTAVAEELALHCGFAWVALLTLYDHHWKLFDDYAARDHPPPTVRHWIMAIDAIEYMRHKHPGLAEVWRRNEEQGWIQAVSATHRATIDYCGKGEQVKLTPQAGGRIIFRSYKVWPLGGMVYGSLAHFPQGQDLDWQEHHRQVRECTERHGRFLEWRKSLAT